MRIRLSLLLLGLLSAGLALSAGVNAATNALAATEPDLALRLRPGDAVALSVRADRRLAASGGKFLPPKASADDARRALRGEPLTAPALRLLAVSEAASDDGGGQASGQVRHLLALAHQVSRRDMATQLLSIEDASSRGDLAETLQYYDEALSTNDAAGGVLFGTLAAALPDPDIRASLKGYAARPWFAAFLAAATDQADALDALTQLVLMTRKQRPTAEGDDLTPRLLAALVAKGHWATAREYVQTLAGADTPVLRRIGFDARTIEARFMPLAWSLHDGTDAGVVLSPKGDLDISIEPSRRSLVAERVTLLSPGHYYLRQGITIDDAGRAARLSWEVSCLGVAGEVSAWRQLVPVRGGSTTYQSQLHLPEGCEAQRWRLYGASEAGQETAQVRIREVRLEFR